MTIQLKQPELISLFLPLSFSCALCNPFNLLQFPSYTHASLVYTVPSTPVPVHSSVTG